MEPINKILGGFLAILLIIIGVIVWGEDNRDIVVEDGNNYVILDDDSDMLYWQRNNYINVDQYVGLTPKQVYKATRFLTGKGHL